jgi:hypothetical protein
MVYVVFKIKSRALDNVQKLNNYISHKLSDLIYGLYSEGTGFESEALYIQENAEIRYDRFHPVPLSGCFLPQVKHKSVNNWRMEVISFNDVRCRV